MLVLALEVHLAAEQFAQQLRLCERGLLDGLSFAEVATGLVDFGDVDFGGVLEVLFGVGLGVPVDFVLVLGVVKG